MKENSKDCLIVSKLYCLVRRMQNNDLPPTHRESHSFQPRPYFRGLHGTSMFVCVCGGLQCKHKSDCLYIYVQTSTKLKALRVQSFNCDNCFPFTKSLSPAVITLLLKRPTMHNSSVFCACFITSQNVRRNSPRGPPFSIASFIIEC